MGDCDSLGPPGEDAIDPPRALHPCISPFSNRRRTANDFPKRSLDAAGRRKPAKADAILSASAHDCQRAAKETGKNTYQMHLASKETEEDHPSEEQP
jgi:hypothetical protein